MQVVGMLMGNEDDVDRELLGMSLNGIHPGVGYDFEPRNFEDQATMSEFSYLHHLSIAIFLEHPYSS
jgi:hypothetical protein